MFGLATVSLLYQLAHTVFPSVFVLWAGYQLDWDARQVGLALAAVGVAGVIVQGGLVRPFVKRHGERRALAIGAFFGTAGFFLYGIAGTVPVFWIGAAVYAPAGFFNPSLMGLISQRVGPSEQGQVQGANSSIMGIAGMIGPGLFTTVFAWSIREGADDLPRLMVAATWMVLATSPIRMRSTGVIRRSPARLRSSAWSR